jgi:TRAP-type mannitol/chloroaromatic compound transport system permease small subunit
MEHNKIYNKLHDLRLDPSTKAWNRIEDNLKRKKIKDSISLIIGVAASFIVILSITLIQINFKNSYKIEFADNKALNENYELYNIEYSIALTKAYSGIIN